VSLLFFSETERERKEVKCLSFSLFKKHFFFKSKNQTQQATTTTTTTTNTTVIKYLYRHLVAHTLHSYHRLLDDKRR